MSGRGTALLLAGLLLPAISGANDNLFERADAAARNGDLSLMQQAYEDILKTDSRNIRALNGKATAQAWRGNYYAAIETYSQVLALDDNDLQALNGIGWAHAWAGDLARAETAFERVRSLDRDNHEAQKGEAYVALWSGDADAATARFARLASEHAEDADIAVALGQAELQRGDARAAVASFDRALTIDPSRSDASAGRRAAFNITPRFEGSAWYGSTSNAESGLRLLELGWWATDATRVSARYDDSLSLDNPAIARRGDGAETVSAQLHHRFGNRFSGLVELGRRALPDGDQSLYRAEAIVDRLPGRVTLGVQFGTHDLGYDDSLYYLGIGIPFASRWEIEWNNYSSTTGIDQQDEWRSVLNLLYASDTGWSAMVGGGAGEIDRGGVANPDRVSLGHAMLTMPIFGFHRLHLVFRHENLPTTSHNVAMLGVTLRFPN